MNYEPSRADTFAAFLAAWFDSGKFQACASELLPMAERSGVELRGKTLRARQIFLGRWLKQQEDVQLIYEGREYRVSVGEFRIGKQFYWIQSNRIHDPAQNDSGTNEAEVQ